MENKNYNKIAFKFLLLLIMAVNMPLKLFAWDFYDYTNGILFSNYGRGMTVIGTLDAELKNLNIPSSINDTVYNTIYSHDVTGIECLECRVEGDIFYPWSLRSIRIPATVRSINKKAFRSYHARQSKLEQYAGSVSDLAEIIVDPENYFYSSVDGVLYNKDKSILISCPPTKAEFDIPATVTQIEAYAFSGCRNLKSLIIPESVTQIGSCAFEGCTNLETITIPNSVTQIESCTFEGCTNLKTITIPNSVVSIGHHAFEDCESLASIDFFSGTSILIDYNAFAGCKSLVSLTISGSEISIRYNAFEDCKSLASINLSGSEISIDQYAFLNCESLASIDISGSPTSIGYGAFMHCKSLASIDISGSPTSIGYRAFEDCKSLASISLSGSEISIDGYAFKDCESLVSVDFSGSLTSIGDWAFEGCKSLVSVSFPASLNYISYDIFRGCGQLKEIHVAPGNEKFADVDGVLYNKDLSELLICPKTVTEFIIPSSVSKIGSYAFSECISLPEITLPASVESIGLRAFRDCTSLLTIKSMRMRPPSTGREAFEGVPMEADVYVPRKTVPYYLASEPWSGFYYFIEVEEWVTGISDVTADAAAVPQDIHTLQGVCVKRDATEADIDALPRGLYIIGGKKVYVK